MTWYNEERVRQPGSAILTKWKAEREASRIKAAVPVSGITAGTEMYDILTGGISLGGAGIPVTEQSAMYASAVCACVSLIGGAIAALPFHIHKRTQEGRERVDSDLWWLFNEQPNPRWTAASAWQFTAQSIALKGDGFWRIHRESDSRRMSAIAGFEPYHPDRVQVIKTGFRNTYVFLEDDGTRVAVDQDDVLHFSGVGFDGTRSITPIRAWLRAAGGIALAADEFAGAFFKNGARPDFALTTPGKLDSDQAEHIRNTWGARHQGPSNAHLPAVLTGGLSVQQLTMSAEDAQLLNTRKFQVEEIARIFGVPPHMIGFTEKTSSWGTGVEQMSIGFVRYTLGRYLDSIQQEINRKIWPRSLKLFGEFNRDALLDGDSKAQAEYFAKALGGPGTQGFMAVNEVRRLKNLKPLPGEWADTVQQSGSVKPKDQPKGSDESTA